jgi:hypothetical protein
MFLCRTNGGVLARPVSSGVRADPMRRPRGAGTAGRFRSARLQSPNRRMCLALKSAFGMTGFRLEVCEPSHAGHVGCVNFSSVELSSPWRMALSYRNRRERHWSLSHRRLGRAAAGDGLGCAQYASGSSGGCEQSKNKWGPPWGNGSPNKRRQLRGDRGRVLTTSTAQRVACNKRSGAIAAGRGLPRKPAGAFCASPNSHAVAPYVAPKQISAQFLNENLIVSH